MYCEFATHMRVNLVRELTWYLEITFYVNLIVFVKFGYWTFDIEMEFVLLLRLHQTLPNL